MTLKTTRRLLAVLALALLAVLAVPTYADAGSVSLWDSLVSWVESALELDEPGDPQPATQSESPPENPPGGGGDDDEMGPQVDPGG